MRLLLIYLLIVGPLCATIAQQNVYLQNNETGHLKKLKRRTILTFQTSDTTDFTGRIIAVTDSSFRLSIYQKNITPDTFNIPIRSVSQVTNKLMNREGSVAGVVGYIGLIAIVTSPFVLITDPPEDALGVLQAGVAMVAFAALLHSPHLIKRKFNTSDKWTLVTK